MFDRYDLSLRPGMEVNFPDDERYKPRRILMREVPECVANREMFYTGGKTLFSWHNKKVGTYLIYSYGTHFPIYVWDGFLERWFGNEDKYNRTTTKHQKHAHPPVPDESIIWLPTQKITQVAALGSFEAMRVWADPHNEDIKFLIRNVVQINDLNQEVETWLYGWPLAWDHRKTWSTLRG